MNSGDLSERAIILAPRGRDADIAAKILTEAGLAADPAPDLSSLRDKLAAGAGLAVIADEAVQGADLRPLADFLSQQPPWSDIPIIILTQRGGGPEKNPPAARLAEGIARSAHLRFAGLQAYHGSAQHVREARERSAHIARAVEHVKETQAALKAVGLQAAIISGAGTGTYENEAASAVYNELQAGSYIFMDADYARNKRGNGEAFDTFEHALFVYATVMSAPTLERLIVDAGLKALSVDSGMPVPWHLPGAVYHRPSDEHGIVDASSCAERPRRGDKVLLVPGHCDPTVNLHDWYVGVRGLAGGKARVDCLWPVAARGALF